MVNGSASASDHADIKHVPSLWNKTKIGVVASAATIILAVGYSASNLHRAEAAANETLNERR